jgi:hypothetical protein
MAKIAFTWYHDSITIVLEPRFAGEYCMSGNNDETVAHAPRRHREAALFSRLFDPEKPTSWGGLIHSAARDSGYCELGGDDISIHAEVTDYGRCGFALLTATAGEEHGVYGLIVIPNHRLSVYRPYCIARQVRRLPPVLRADLRERLSRIKRERPVGGAKAFTMPISGFLPKAARIELDRFQRAFIPEMNRWLTRRDERLDTTTTEWPRMRQVGSRAVLGAGLSSRSPNELAMSAQ